MMSKSNKLIISAVLTGAMTPKSACANLPVTQEEIAADVVACAKAGAAAVHFMSETKRISLQWKRGGLWMPLGQ